VFQNFRSVPRGDSFNLPGFSFLSNQLRSEFSVFSSIWHFGLTLVPYSFNLPEISILSNRLPVRFIRTAKPDLAFRNSQATAYRLFRSGAVSTRSSVEAFYWWLPGSGPAFRRSLPLGARRTLRVLATLVKSFLRFPGAPCRRASNLTQPPSRGRCSPPA
jgi:hypothetical protein